MNTIPRSEHPKPQFQRDKWMNLNGQWAFEIDNGRSGKARGLHQADAQLSDTILVPFCPQSQLSGVNHKDFLYGVWYRRTVDLTKEQLSGRVVLHFGAVDYHCEAFVNGVSVGTHTGGYVSFCFDVTEAVHEGENVITVYAEDDERDPLIPRGKQSELFYSHGCDYTRTTGIWQTVWMEFLPETHIEKIKIFPNVETGSFDVEALLKGAGTLAVEASYEGRPMGAASVKADGGLVRLHLSLQETHLWELGCGRLYDLKLTYGADTVQSYAGLRSVRLDGYRFLLNGRSVFQRTVLDQGFYPDGIYTAPTEEALVKDVELSMAAGFNGARLHQKVFEPLFLYHCDKAGYLVWGEQGCWGLDYSNPAALKYFLPEWMEALERDFNHPAIIGWCPFNETWDYEGRRQDDSLLANVYKMTKLYDTTRPCIDTSGNYHVVTDIYDLHNYEQDPAKFAATYESFKQGGDLEDNHGYRQTPVKGIPTFISEYGGIKWDEEGVGKDGWGYGAGPATKEEFLNRYKGLTDALLDNPHMFAFCYTQLYDVEQELNGLYTYERKPKFDMDVIKAINARKAAIED